MISRGLVLAAALLLAAGPAPSAEPIRLANNPALSPNGADLVFDWNGDLWTVPAAGGVARQLTFHPGQDFGAKFAPDGKALAFVSDRTGTVQVFTMPFAGGAPKQLTNHASGHTLEGWSGDGKRLLVNASRDHHWRHGQRFFWLNADARGPETLLFDDHGQQGALSPDGKKLLFTREGETWWRKGYRGSQAAQLWLYDLETKSFTPLIRENVSARWPLWRPDGQGFYYVSGRSGVYNLYERDLGSGADRALTHSKDDAVVFPCLSGDGHTLVYRQLFDFYRLDPTRDSPPQRLDIVCNTDRALERIERRSLTTATDAAFTADGLEIAFIAGGDLWVMDTELREPRPVLVTPELEGNPLFAPDGKSLLFTADRDAGSEVYRVTRADESRHWWQNTAFKVVALTGDGEVKGNLRFSPDGSKISYSRGRGDLWVSDPDGGHARKVVPSWNALDYDWSPDGKWLVYAQSDDDFNRDVWVLPLDGSRKPFNLSRHPYNDSSPVWSPDGRMIAFVGRHDQTEVDVFHVYLRAEDDEKGSRERTIEKALDKINKARTPALTRVPGLPKKDGDAPDVPAEDERKPGPRRPQDGPTAGAKAPVEVVIDFDRIHERVRRLSIPDSAEASLFWSPDSKRLAFTATVGGTRATYAVEFPDDLKPKSINAATGSGARWLSKGNQVVWLSGGVPASFTPGSAPAATAAPAGPSRFGGGGRSQPSAQGPATGSEGGGYRFTALQKLDLRGRNRAAFDLCWRTMRDNFYDDRLGNRDWNAVRAKYLDMAGAAPDMAAFTTVVQLMLGELNGSHLGFTAGGGARRRGGAPATPAPGPDPGPGGNEPVGPGWTETTAHLGVRFDPAHAGEGLKVRDVLTGGPAERSKSRLRPGEVILAIDGTSVGLKTDLTEVLNGVTARDISLRVKAADGQERDLTLRPITYTVARALLYNQWLENNRKAVEEASRGTLGYVHISAMLDPSFTKFIEELYSVGAGKDGLIIDVRENGGGSTADHLLTALTQPAHAIAVPRGGGAGYPQDRKIYATWQKPIVVLCNQNSFSNAEIFSHAIKTLKRGRLVGVPTAGGVISTGAAPIMDLGMIRVPFRGWHLLGDGQDMELNGAVPDYVVWPKPGDLPRGKDDQLLKAVEVLKEDVKVWKDRPHPPLQRATERPVSVSRGGE